MWLQGKKGHEQNYHGRFPVRCFCSVAQAGCPGGIFLFDLDGTATREGLPPGITAHFGVDKETEARGDIADVPHILPAAEPRQFPVLAADTGRSEIAHPSKNGVLA
jgi:hypothetical protein